MVTATEGFPQELLTEVWTARLAYFQSYTIAHPRLVEAKQKLMSAIQESSRNSLVMILGPTGVGKTTLRVKTEQILTEGALSELEADRARIPVVSVEAIAPEYGNFNWRDQFKRILLQMREPLVGYKCPPAGRRNEESEFYASLASKASAAAYRYAVEQALRHRQPFAVLIDEAQHMAKVTSGRRLLDQLDVIKSIANLTSTVHVLFGTYDLLAFHNLNGQLSRRSVDIHFRRYQAENEEDRKVFVNIVHSFAQRLPFAEPPDLAEDWEYLYERSIGCIGILKDWLVRALTQALKMGRTSLMRKDLEGHALSVSQCEKMLSEAVEGELRLQESEEGRSRLRTRLGLGDSNTGRDRVSGREILTRRGRVRPGQRRPKRDGVGKPAVSYAGNL
jgi:energy-coupling factor transporter ATP-binding protein EcfA2